MVDVEDRIRELAAGRESSFGIYARHLATNETVAVNADRVMPTESAAKTFILVHYTRMVAAGSCDPNRRVTITDEDSVFGSGVLRHLAPGLAPKLDDLAWLMIIVSDNLATNRLLRELGGPDAINETMDALGLPTARVHGPCMHSEFGTSTPRDLAEVYVHLDERARTILYRQQFVDLLPRRVPHVSGALDFGVTMPLRVFNKPGSGAFTCTDSALFEMDHAAWVVAVMGRDLPEVFSRTEDSAPVAFATIGQILYEAWGTDAGR
jgi:Beta-lactamase enzyme family